MAKDKDYMRLINSLRWRRMRMNALSAHPLCQRCEEKGRLEPATEVHHVIPVETAVLPSDKEALMFDPHNLRCLCHNCHVLTHMEMGRSGREARRRRNEEHLRWVAERFLE